MKQKIILIISVVAGVLAFWLTSRYLQNQRLELIKAKEALRAGMEMFDVVAAAEDLPAGTVLTIANLGQRKVSRRDVGDKAVQPENLRLVLGKKLKYGMKKLDPLMWPYVDVRYAPISGLAATIESGRRAVSVSVGGAAAVSGLIQPNDRVDILGTFSFPSKKLAGEMETVTLTILQDVTVLATGQILARDQAGGASEASRKSASSYSTVTLEVTPREAELLVFAENMKGRMVMTLRNPEDISYEVNLPEINFEHLEKKLPELNLIRQRDIRHKQ